MTLETIIAIPVIILFALAVVSVYVLIPFVSFVLIYLVVRKLSKRRS